LYDVLYAPPFPFTFGSMVKESWSCIEQRLYRDPIALTLKTAGHAPIMRFMDSYFQDLSQALRSRLQTLQQMLYLILLDPMRRLLLNTYLAAAMTEQGVYMTVEKKAGQELAAVLACNTARDREHALNRLYGLS